MWYRHDFRWLPYCTIEALANRAQSIIHRLYQKIRSHIKIIDYQSSGFVSRRSQSTWATSNSSEQTTGKLLALVAPALLQAAHVHVMFEYSITVGKINV